MLLLTTKDRLSITKVSNIQTINILLDESHLELSVKEFESAIRTQIKYIKGLPAHVKVIAAWEREDTVLIYDGIVAIVVDEVLRGALPKEREYKMLPPENVAQNVFLSYANLMRFLNNQCRLPSFTITIHDKEGLFWQMIKEDTPHEN